MIFIEGGAYRAASEVADTIDGDGDVFEHVTKACIEALAMVQGYITRDINASWPDLAQALKPAVDVSDEEIRLSFRNKKRDCVLELPVVRW
jgi:hypothetical protein